MKRCSFRRVMRGTGPQQEKCMKVMCPWLWILCGFFFGGRGSCWSPSEILLSVLIPKITLRECKGKRMVQSSEVAGNRGGSDWQRRLNRWWWVLSQPSYKNLNSPWICWWQSDSSSEHVLSLCVVKDGKFFLGCVGARPDEMKGDRKGPFCNISVFCVIRQLC